VVGIHLVGLGEGLLGCDWAAQREKEKRQASPNKESGQFHGFWANVIPLSQRRDFKIPPFPDIFQFDDARFLTILWFGRLSPRNDPKKQ
jgi:hypothetical protein